MAIKQTKKSRTHSNIQITIIAPQKITPQGKTTWEPDPKPLMANHPPRVTDSNTRIALLEGSLNGPCPQDDSGLGWVQIQLKSLLWEEKIEGFSVITHEGLTTLAHPEIGWTIVYYESIKRELNKRLIFDSRCDVRLKTKAYKTEGYTRLTCTMWREKP